MNNTFEDAKTFAHEFFQNIYGGLDSNSAIRLMTEWHAKLTDGTVKEAVSTAASSLEADYKAKITELEQIVTDLKTSHKEALTKLKEDLTKDPTAKKSTAPKEAKEPS